MPAEKNLKIIHDFFLLYELSLAVGGSLDSQENCQRFIKVLISQKGLTYAAVWLRENTESPARLFCSAPERQLIQEEIGPDHFIWQQLDQKSFFSLRDTDTNFRELVQEDDIAGGAYSVFGLGELGFLKFFSAGRLSAFSKMEMSQLETVIHKFKVSLEGCLAHDRLMKESQRRLEMQKALKRSNERFVDLFENMNDALVIFDAEGNIIEANRAARKLALIDQLPGPNLWHLVPPEEVEKTKELYRSLLEKGENAGFEIRIVIPGGEEKYIQVN